MTDQTPKRPITSIEILLAHWTDILSAGEQRGRTLWFMFHRDDGTPHDVVIAIDGVPLRPDVHDAWSLESMVRMSLAAAPEYPHCIALLSRPGTHHRSPFEIEWAKSLSALSQFMVWPICCGTPHGVTPLEYP